MYVVVGRFRFVPMPDDARMSMVKRMEAEVPQMARECHGFRSLHFVRLGDDELMTVWQWDSEADWDNAQPRFGPSLQEYVVPHLAGPPERAGGEVVFQVTP